jgi:ribose transport system permease protein
VTILLAAGIYIVLAQGMSFVLISGATDLSAGSVVGVSGTICALCMVQFGMPLLPSVLLGLLSGVLCGLLNGFLVTKARLIPFIATLGTQWVFRGIANILSNGIPVNVRDSSIPNMAESFYTISAGRVFNIPVSAYIFVITGLALTFLLSRTVLGRNLYAVGSNSEAARLSGINVVKTKMLAYVICDGMAGLAGIILASRLMSSQPGAGEGYHFEGIFAAVIGGVSLSGGTGTILGAIIGAFVVAILRNGLNLNGVGTFWQQVILGVIILIAVYVDNIRTERQLAATK